MAVTRGLITMAMMFVSSPTVFYVLRLLLGAAEAGLYPGIMYLITTWFAQKDRATVVGLILTASSVASIVANPIGGALMKLDGIGGLHGWQWLFVLEGIPTVLLGVLIFFVLPNSPAKATRLDADEAAELTRRAVGEEPEESRPGAIIRNAMSKPFLLTIAAIYFMNQIATYGVIFFVPSIVEAMDVTDSFMIGLISGVVGIGAVVGVLVVPRILRRRPGSEVPLIGITTAAAIVFALVFIAVDNPVAKMVILSVTMLFIVGVQPLYWSVLMARLGGVAAAAGLAFVNTIGLTGGFVGPYAFGLTEEATGSPSSGLWVLVAATTPGPVLVPLLSKMLVRHDRTRDAAEPEVEAVFAV
uniref:MFS transporter n=1 Tax=Janibacter limosus TaxID=53458 RepID=A0AC61U878_9MICO|nr:MFS transporter [Janibacter limosus]